MKLNFIRPNLDIYKSYFYFFTNLESSELRKDNLRIFLARISYKKKIKPTSYKIIVFYTICEEKFIRKCVVTDAYSRAR